MFNRSARVGSWLLQVFARRRHAQGGNGKAGEAAAGNDRCQEEAQRGEEERTG